MNTLEHLKLIRDNPGVYKTLPDNELADLLLQLLETKSLFKKAKVEIKDGYTPQPGIDYLSREEQETMIRNLVGAIEIPKPKDGEDGKDGEDAVVTPEEIEGIVNTVYDALFPQLPVPLTSEEIRDRLELLLDDDRLCKEAVKGIDEIEKDIERLKGARGIKQAGGVSKNAVQDMIDEATANLTCTEYTVEKDEGNPVSYIGEAIPGTETSEEAWRIRKIDETDLSDVTVLFADNKQFTQVWDDRTTLIYG